MRRIDGKFCSAVGLSGSSTSCWRAPYANVEKIEFRPMRRTAWGFVNFFQVAKRLDLGTVFGGQSPESARLLE
jgi:hypothetical protein